MNNKDFEPIRIRIMQEAYNLADEGSVEGYNAVKVMCGDVQKMLPPQRTWVDLTDNEVVYLKMLGRDLEFVSMTALRRFARDIAQTLKEKNNV